VRNDLETSVLTHVEALACRLNGVTTVGISSNVLVDRLNTDFEASAAVAEHGAVVKGVGRR
jgi:hypothetical protein